MTPQLYILIGSALLFMTVTGGILGLLIGWVAKKFRVDSDPKIEILLDLLPGVNCGGCGFAGCADFAKALAAGSVKEPERCPASSPETVQEIAEVLGLTHENGFKKVAVILCGGSNRHTVQGARYNGIADCKSAILVSAGVKGCPAGCLGYASCAHACPFNAIEMADGLAKVHPALCVGCGKCIETCPRKLIKLVPADATVHVYCNSKERGPLKRQYCKAACIGCRKCGKAAGEGQITFEGFLAKINYENPPSIETVGKANCPGGCLGYSHDLLPSVTPEENAS